MIYVMITDYVRHYDIISVDYDAVHLNMRRHTIIAWIALLL